jgi:hypothetical protein
VPPVRARAGGCARFRPSHGSRWPRTYGGTVRGRVRRESAPGARGRRGGGVRGRRCRAAGFERRDRAAGAVRADAGWRAGHGGERTGARGRTGADGAQGRADSRPGRPRTTGNSDTLDPTSPTGSPARAGAPLLSTRNRHRPGTQPGLGRTRTGPASRGGPCARARTGPTSWGLPRPPPVAPGPGRAVTRTSCRPPPRERAVPTPPPTGVSHRGRRTEDPRHGLGVFSGPGVLSGEVGARRRALCAPWGRGWRCPVRATAGRREESASCRADDRQRGKGGTTRAKPRAGAPPGRRPREESAGPAPSRIRRTAPSALRAPSPPPPASPRGGRG